MDFNELIFFRVFVDVLLRKIPWRQGKNFFRWWKATMPFSRAKFLGFKMTKKRWNHDSFLEFRRIWLYTIYIFDFCCTRLSTKDHCYSYHGILVVGMQLKHAEVAEVQQRLQLLAMEAGRPDVVWARLDDVGCVLDNAGQVYLCCTKKLCRWGF